MEYRETQKKEEILRNAANVLKSKFFGIDEVINQIIGSLSSWYHFPEIQQRPLIINLWGMTGVGKTDLVRELVKLIDYQDHFFEFDCGKLKNGKSFLTHTIDRLTIHNGPINGVIMLDEFQHLASSKFFKVDHDDEVRTMWELIDSGQAGIYEGWDLLYDQVERIYEDLNYWISRGLKVKEGMVLAESHEFLQKRKLVNNVRIGGSEKDIHWVENFIFNNDDINNLFQVNKKQFKSKASFIDYLQTLDEVQIFQFVRSTWSKTVKMTLVDFSKSVIFIVGNLDEVYHFASDVTADISPDEFYKDSLGIKLPLVKKTLLELFRPEQVARLGNNHIIYPSLNSEAYRKIIQRELVKTKEHFEKLTGIPIDFDFSVENWLFEEGVTPAQGARPLISTIKYSINDTIPQIVWMMANGARRTIRVNVSMEDGDSLVAHYISPSKGRIRGFFPVTGKVKKLKENKGNDFQALVGVHEAGHGILHFFCYGNAPKYMLSVTSEAGIGGFVMDNSLDNLLTYNSLRKTVIVSLGGFLAEKIVFGEQNISLGSTQDFQQASALVLKAFKEAGFGGMPMTFAKNSFEEEYKFHSIEDIEKKAFEFITNAFEEAARILNQEKMLLVETGKALLESPRIKAEEFEGLIREFGTDDLINSASICKKGFKELLLSFSGSSDPSLLS